MFALIRLIQIFVICVLAIPILRPWLKIGVLNPKKTKLNLFDRLYLSIFQIILALIILTGIAVIIPLTLIISVVMPNRREFLHRQGRFWTALFLKAIGVTVSVEGTENIPAGPVIFVQNIRTYLDGAASLSQLPGSFRMIFQRHLMEAPLLGWIEKILGYLALEEKNIGLIQKDIGKIVDMLKSGESVLAFAEETPEGSSIHGGTAFIALHSKLPVVPIGVVRKLTAPEVGAFLAKPFPYEIKIKIGKPLRFADLIDDKANREKAKTQIAREIKEMG